MKTSAIIVAALIAAFFSGCPANDPVVAEVNGIAIRTSALDAAVAREKRKYDHLMAQSDESMSILKQQTLDMLIQEAVLLDEAHRQGIAISDEEFTRALEERFGTGDLARIRDSLKDKDVDANAWLASQRNRFLIAKLIRRTITDTIPVSEEEVAAYYKKHRDDYRQPVQYRAQQILVDTKERADEIAARLAKGEDFGELARAYSVSPDAERGGDLGFFSTKGLPAVFSEICASLKKGSISKVKKTAYGYQLFKLLDRRPPRTIPLDEVREEITEIIRSERGKKAFAAWFDELKSKAHITRYDKSMPKTDSHVQTSTTTTEG